MRKNPSDFDWNTTDPKRIRETRLDEVTVIYTYDGKIVHLISIRTKVKSQGKGKARAVLLKLCKEADDRGASIVLEASPLTKSVSLSRLVSFYESLGFIPTGRTINPLGDPELIRYPEAPDVKKNRPRSEPHPESQLDNPAFRRWFGDSVVVDENGAPLVVWHGTPEHVERFYIFDFNRAIDLGMHLGTLQAAKEAASGMNPTVRPFYLRLNQPFIAADPGDWISGNRGIMSTPPILDQMARKGLISKEEYDEAESKIDSLKDEAKAKSERFREGDAGFTKYRSKASALIQDLLGRAGYDGVVYQNETEDTGNISWIAFRPEQIKSADENDGSFDPENPDVRKNPGRTFIPPQKVADEAAYGLYLRSQMPPSSRCCTPVGLARAKQLKNREPVSVETLKRMRSYFQRHEVDQQGKGWGIDSKGFQAWLLWGGDSGRDWCNRTLDQLRK